MLLYIYIYVSLSPNVKCVCWFINHINHIDYIYIYTINPHVKPVKLQSTKLLIRTWGTLIKALGLGICRDAGAQSTSALVVSATLGAGPHRPAPGMIWGSKTVRFCGSKCVEYEEKQHLLSIFAEESEESSEKILGTLVGHKSGFQTKGSVVHFLPQEWQRFQHVTPMTNSQMDRRVILTSAL